MDNIEEKNEPKLKASSSKQSHIVKIMWKTFGILVLLTFIMFVLIYNGIIGYMPPIAELKNPTDNFASIIYSDDGVEMGRFYRNQGNRVYADLDEISPHLINALIATEDVRYLEHSGIDMRALMRAVIKRGLLRQKNAGGGSTITQQLAKQLYSPSSSSTVERLLQKPIEWVIAVKLERYYTKDEIIKMYFNQFDFLNNAVGIKTAAFVYFGKEPKDLNLDESATLVGMLNNPAFYNPLRFPERTRERRNVVLEKMYKAGMLSEAELETEKNIETKIKYHKVDHKDGLAPYFREELRRVMTAKKPNRKNYSKWNQQQFVDDSIAWVTNPLFGWCEKNTKPDGSHYDIYTDGLKIHTTIDSRMQAYAEKAVLRHLGKDLQPKFRRERGGMRNPYTSNTEELSSSAKKNLIRRAILSSERARVLKSANMSDAEIINNFNEPVSMRVFSYSGSVDTVMTPLDSLLYTKSFLRTGMMSMDPVTGYVKAYVGGPSFYFFQYDMVATGRRQIGSTVKPFLYALAMEEGFTPCDRLLNAQPVIGNWAPRNSGHGRIGEMVDLRWALTYSNNWISARLMEKLGPDNLVRIMHTMGVTNHLDNSMPICLGTPEVSIKEMVTAYTVFANKGMRTDPIFVSRITDNQGNTIAEFTPQQSEVLSEDAYYKILYMLINVVNSGTGSRLRQAPYNITAEMGGKTGTTNDNTDAWFMGFTPQLITGVWVGGEEKYIHFSSMTYGQGAAAALPLYGLYMKYVYADPSLPYNQDVKFQFPEKFEPCYKEGLGGLPDDMIQESDDAETVDESIDGAFD